MKSISVSLGSLVFLVFSTTASASWGTRFHKTVVFPVSSESPYVRLSCDFYNSQNQANGLGQITTQKYDRKLGPNGKIVIWTNVMDVAIEDSSVDGADALYQQNFVTIPKTDANKPKFIYSISYGQYQSPDTQTILLDESVTFRKNASLQTDPLIKYIDEVCSF